MAHLGTQGGCFKEALGSPEVGSQELALGMVDLEGKESEQHEK